jgi:hypothetical protein
MVKQLKQKINMDISLIDLSKEPDFIIPIDGKYLVRRVSLTDKTVNGNYSSVSWFSCRVTKHFDEKKKVWKNSFDCSATVTHISKLPIEMFI